MTTQTFPISGPISLVGRVGHGSFTVHARDDVTEASVTVVPQSKDSDVLDRATIELRGATLYVTLPRQGGVFDLPLFGGRRTRDAVDITVTVPSGAPVKITTLAAPITVEGRCGNADLAAGSSTINLDDVDGDLRLRFGSGSARAKRVSGTVETRAGSGDVELGEVHGALTSACGSGQIDVAVARGPVRFRTGSGGARFGAVYSDVDVATGSGGLSIGLPAGRTARLDVTSGTGQVASELPIENAPKGKGTPITVRARTGSGDVRLFRAA